MIHVKNNYKNAYKNLACRACQKGNRNPRACTSCLPSHPQKQHHNCRKIWNIRGKPQRTSKNWQKNCSCNRTRQIWGIWKLRPAYSPEMPNLAQNQWCFVSCDLEIWWMTLENNRVSLLCCFKLCATFHSHWWIQTEVTVRKRPIWIKLDNF